MSENETIVRNRMRLHREMIWIKGQLLEESRFYGESKNIKESFPGGRQPPAYQPCALHNEKIETCPGGGVGPCTVRSLNMLWGAKLLETLYREGKGRGQIGGGESLCCKAKCVMGNGHMSPPPLDRQKQLKTLPSASSLVGNKSD